MPLGSLEWQLLRGIWALGYWAFFWATVGGHKDPDSTLYDVIQIVSRGDIVQITYQAGLDERPANKLYELTRSEMGILHNEIA